jgi:hypothetical protein
MQAADELTAQTLAAKMVQAASPSFAAVPSTPVKRTLDLPPADLSPSAASSTLSPPAKPISSPSIDKDKEKLAEWEAKVEQERQESERR